jgi:SAM-dependent methyltransferase
MRDIEIKPLTFSKEWTEKFYEREDPWGVKKYKGLQQRASRALKILGRQIYNLGIDLCCGEGTITVDILSNYCKHVVGIDFSETAIQRAKELSKNAPNVQFVNADVIEIDYCKLGLTPDLIFCSDAFFYFNRSQQKTIMAKIAELKNLPKILLVIRLQFKQFCSEHPELVEYAPDYDFFDTWDELREIAKGNYDITRIEPVLEHVPQNIPWGDNIIAVNIRKVFYFLFVKALSRFLTLNSDTEKIDKMRFQLLRAYYRVPVLQWIMKRFIFFYGILLEPRIEHQ